MAIQNVICIHTTFQTLGGMTFLKEVHYAHQNIVKTVIMNYYNL